MKGSIGCPTRIITRLPHQGELAKHGTVELSKKAKRRLEILDWYFNESAKFSLTGLPEVKLTCRHFGIYRRQFGRVVFAMTAGMGMPPRLRGGRGGERAALCAA